MVTEHELFYLVVLAIMVMIMNVILFARGNGKPR